jgi:hypothetical protein
MPHEIFAELQAVFIQVFSLQVVRYLLSTTSEPLPQFFPFILL